ncbi:DegV family protein [Halanaerobacter jeridensis]|uniref:DegV family protein with EDD domain n=1 Tax=Halanaerobacter jeridensis TaxID=706427 RepID=A0A939BP78_9FIRM|nr:DegV family protein [Halanaerobacter jeridensis]MBM7556433.1 DegV family protein with EDD domain [Halanaerobacter jeridensis]
MEVAIVTDSTADLPLNKLEEYNITRIPLKVSIGGEEYLDQIDLTKKEFLKKLESTEELPTTSQPALGQFIDAYERLAEDYDYILSIHISEKFSGTIKTAHTASNMIEGAKIEVVDSETVTAPLGVIVTEVAKAAHQGQSMEDLLNLIDQLKEQINLYFTVDELDYLEKGGRIGKAAAFLGNLFKIRPLLTVEDGEVSPYKKIRGKRRLYNEFLNLASELRVDGTNNLIILHGLYPDKAYTLKEKLTTEYDWETIEVQEFGSVVGAHVGPTPFGMVIC